MLCFRLRCGRVPKEGARIVLISFKHFAATVVYLADTFTCPISGTLVPIFWVSGDASSGFHNQSRSCLIHIAEANVDLMYIPWDPPLVLHISNFLMVSIVGQQFKTMAHNHHLPAHFPRLSLELSPGHVRSSSTPGRNSEIYLSLTLHLLLEFNPIFITHTTVRELMKHYKIYWVHRDLWSNMKQRGRHVFLTYTLQEAKLRVLNNKWLLKIWDWRHIWWDIGFDTIENYT